MICQKCHKNLATIRYAEVINGRVSDLMICSECYTAMEQADTTGFEIAGVAPTPKRARARQPAARKVAARKRCASCGMELQHVLETGMVGCAVCYQEFRDELAPLLADLHAGLRHRGKMRDIDDDRERLRAELQTKRALLRTALQMENYEEAATLRDVIREIEATLGAFAKQEG